MRWMFLMLVLLSAKPLDACEPPAAHVEAVLPANGAIDIPTNSYIWIFFNSGALVLPEAPFVLRQVSAEGTSSVVVTNSKTVRVADWEGSRHLTMLMPTSPLAELTTYTLEIEPGLFYEAVDTTFTTGAWVDSVPPGFSSPTAVEVTSIPKKTFGSCGPWADLVHYEVYGSKAEDAVLYMLYYEGVDSEESILADVTLGFPASLFWAGRPSGYDCFFVSTLDLANNQAVGSDYYCVEDETPCVESCKEPHEHDTNDPTTNDESLDDPRATGAARGCACALNSAATGGPALAPLAMLVLWGFVRRRFAI